MMYPISSRLPKALLPLFTFLLFSFNLQAQVIFEIGTVTSNPNAEVNIPITVRNFSGVAGIQGQLQLPAEATFLEFESIHSALTDFDSNNFHDLGDGNINILWLETNLINISIPDDEVLFEIKVQVNASIGDEISISFANVLVSDNTANPISVTVIEGKILIDPLLFTVGNQESNTGNTIDIPVSVSNFNEVVGFQLSINYPADKANFISLDNFNAALTDINASSYFSPSDGLVNLLWDEANLNSISLVDDEVLFTIKLEITATAPDTFLSLTYIGQ